MGVCNWFKTNIVAIAIGKATTAPREASDTDLRSDSAKARSRRAPKQSRIEWESAIGSKQALSPSRSVKLPQPREKRLIRTSSFERQLPRRDRLQSQQSSSWQIARPTKWRHL